MVSQPLLKGWSSWVPARAAQGRPHTRDGEPPQHMAARRGGPSLHRFDGVCRLDDQTRAQRQSSACDVAMYSETQEISQQALKPDDGPSVIEPDERRYAGRACDDPRDCLSTGSHKTACVPLSPGSTRAFKGAFHANSGSNLRRACEGMLPLCCKRGRSQAAQSTAQACNCVARGCGSIETRRGTAQARKCVAKGESIEARCGKRAE
jgi:hypothetical protein